MLDALERRGAAGRTIVVLTGDTSAPTGAHGALGRGDLLFEETLRVPLVIAAPAVSSPGTPAPGLVELVDVYPTLLELCGLPRGGRPRRARASALCWATRTPPSARPPSLPSGRAAGQIGRSLRTARWRYTEWPDGSEELYDHEADPREFDEPRSAPRRRPRRGREMRRLTRRPRGRGAGASPREPPAGRRDAQRALHHRSTTSTRTSAPTATP